MVAYYNSLGEGEGMVCWLDSHIWAGWVIAIFVVIWIIIAENRQRLK